MRKHDVRKWLHAVLDLLPVILIPVFMIYSHRHTIDSGSIQVQEKVAVDFNQQLDITDFRNSGLSYTNVNGRFEVTNITNNTLSNPELLRFEYFNFELNHIYYLDKQDGNYQLRFWSSDNATSFYGTDQRYKIPVQNNNVFQMYLIGSIEPNETFTFTRCVYDLTQMFGVGNEPTIEQFKLYFPNDYYPYTKSQKVLIDGDLVTYNDTDIMSQMTYQLYNSVDKYFNMGNVFNLNGVYDWFNLNIFNGSAPIYMFIVWQIVLYEFVMDLMFLLYGLFMWFIDMVEKLMDKPLNSVK